MVITEEMIPEIEKAIGVKLYDQQKEYLLHNKPMYGGRGTGKTVAFCIKLALDYERNPLDLRFPETFCDSDYGISDKQKYARQFFRDEFMTIRSRLRHHGFKVVNVRIHLRDGK